MARQSAQSAERCLDILELLIAEPSGLGISQIAERLDLPLSATHRLLQVLVDKGYAGQGPGSTQYQATKRIAVLGLRQLADDEVIHLCQPYLDDLAGETGELIRLAVRDGASMIWVAKAQGSTASLRHDPINGREVPLHTTAMGKAWLASMPEEDAVALVTEKGYAAELMGPNAIVSEPALRVALADIRKKGFATAIQESELGLCAVAMLVRHQGPDRRVVGAVSIAGPSYRVDETALLGFVPALKRTITDIESIWPVS